MSTQEEKLEKVYQVYEMLLVGFTRYQILKYAKSQLGWDIAEITIDKYIAEAKEIIKKHAKEYESEQFELSLNRLEDLYNKLEREGKYKEALEVMKERNKLIGLYAPEKKDIRIENITELTDDDLIKLISDE